MRSKIFFTIYMTGILFLVLSSCNNDFLNRNPLSSPNTGNYYQNESQIEGALIAAYDQLGNLAGEFVTINEFKSDNFQYWQYIESAYANNTYDRWESGLWLGLYQLVFRANQVINHVDNIESQEKNRFLGEARFIRGLAYFWLVRCYGEVPIVTGDSTLDGALNMSRASISDVYALVEDDFQFAVDNLPEESSKGRANKYVVEAELARAYIMQSGYPVNEDKLNEAIPLLEDIINSGKYRLEENYADIFTLEGENGPEVIWSAVMDANPNGNRHREAYLLDQFAGARSICDPEFAEGEDPLLGNLWLSFESEDQRRDVSLDTAGLNNVGNTLKQMNNAKYRYGHVQGFGWTSDYIFTRYANVLLLYAEILHKTDHISVIGNKWDIVNRIRNRAGLENVSEDANFMEILLNERRHEFVWEAVRWFDLVRTNTFVEELKKVQHDNAADFWKYLPIPIDELEKMGGLWENNEGY